MVIEEEEKTTPKQLDLFEDRLPNRPYYADEKGYLSIGSKATAIKKKYIQHNQPCIKNWLVYDCDFSGALEWVGDNHLPVPNLVAYNPKNGNSHLYYCLEDPVCTSEKGKWAPLFLLAKIDYVLTEKLKADKGYQGFISKNVLHEHWNVLETNPTPWKLDDFLNWIELPKRLPKKAQIQGLGRNCTLFETAKNLAYRSVLNFRLAGSKEGFFAAVLSDCEGINQTFNPPLNLAEVKATAKSIAKWTWKHYTGSGSMSAEDWAQYVKDTHTHDKQKYRQTLQVKSRRKGTKTAREEAKEMRARGRTQAVISKVLGVSQQTVSRWLKEQ